MDYNFEGVGVYEATWGRVAQEHTQSFHHTKPKPDEFIKLKEEIKSLQISLPWHISNVEYLFVKKRVLSHYFFVCVQLVQGKFDRQTKTPHRNEICRFYNLHT